MKDYKILYENALERVKDFTERQNPPMLDKEIMHQIFPELRESEDERIRKWIRKELESKYVVDNIVNNVMANKALAWLEKQSEHAKFRESIQVGDKVTRNEAGDLVNLSQLERIAKPSQCENRHYVEVCGDNRFEIIEKAKKDIISSTNIETRPEEMSVLDSFLFRCWQMGWLERYEEQKSSWSEEDEKIYSLIYSAIKNDTQIASPSNKKDAIDWLNSLKDRVEPKQEWSEEDEKMLISALCHVSNSASNGKSTDYQCEVTDWLKSLKPRWKPSEEQMEALLYALGKGGTYNHEALTQLYNNLKTL